MHLKSRLPSGTALLPLAALLITPHVVAACSSSSSAGAATPIATPDSGGSPPPEDAAPAIVPDAAPVVDPVCEAFHAKLDADLNDYATTAGAKHESVFALSTPRCGTHVSVAHEETPGVARGYPVGSITKTYVAATVMSLVDEGKVALDTPVGTYLPDIPSGEVITVRNLLSHRSGLYNYTASNGYSETATYTPAQLVAIAAAQPRGFTPGSEFSYSNTNYIVLGMLVEAVTKTTAERSIRARALAPASLQFTWMSGLEAERAPVASGWRTGTAAATPVNPSGPWTAGSMVATPSDALKWMRALIRSEVLAQDITDQMIPEPRRGAYGLGLLALPASDTLGLGNMYGHAGAVGTFRSQLFYSPDRDVTVFAATTQRSFNPNDILIATLPDVATFLDEPKP